MAKDKAIHIQNLCEELRCFILRTVVPTDNLSLRRVVYSGRPINEMRLRREIATIRDMIVRDGIQLRHVPSEEMIADPLTKSMDASKLLQIGGKNIFNRIEMHDNEKTTERDLVEETRSLRWRHCQRGWKRSEENTKQKEALRSLVRWAHRTTRDR